MVSLTHESVARRQEHEWLRTYIACYLAMPAQTGACSSDTTRGDTALRAKRPDLHALTFHAALSAKPLDIDDNRHYD